MLFPPRSDMFFFCHSGACSTKLSLTSSLSVSPLILLYFLHRTAHHLNSLCTTIVMLSSHLHVYHYERSSMKAGTLVHCWYPSAKEKPQEDGRRSEITFRIKPHTHQRRLEVSNKKPCVHQDPETPQRLSQTCLWVSPMEAWVSSGLSRGQGLWLQQTWEALRVT